MRFPARHTVRILMRLLYSGGKKDESEINWLTKLKPTPDTDLFIKQSKDTSPPTLEYGNIIQSVMALCLYKFSVLKETHTKFAKRQENMTDNQETK